MTPEYLTLAALSSYSGMSARTLRRRLQGARPLPHFRNGRKIMVKRSEFDAWMEASRAQQDAIERRAARILSEMGI